MQILELDIWSDIACPWCYIGTRRLRNGIARFHQTHPGTEVAITYRSFLLTPDMDLDFAGSEADFLVDRKGVPRAQVQEMLDTITGIARTEGLELDFATLRPANTAKAHELLHFAKSRGRQAETNERLFRAHFGEGRHVGRVEDLAELATEAGLDRGETLKALRSGAYEAAVRADLERAAALGIRGVPFYVIDDSYGVSGAQSPETFAAALERAVTDEARAPRGR